MITSPTPVAFIGVSDIDRAQAFYVDLLGLDLSDERPYALASPTLRITQVPVLAQVPWTICGLGVDDIEAEVRALTARGLTFTVYDGMGQDDLGIWTAPDGTRVAWFADPDGNTLSLQSR